MHPDRVHPGQVGSWVRALLNGDLAAQASSINLAAEAFRDALSVAQELGMRMTQLRAATRLARPSPSSESSAEALDVPRRLYETFDAGSMTQDLLEARSVLDSHNESPVSGKTAL